MSRIICRKGSTTVVVDSETELVLVNDVSIELTRGEYAILELILRYNGAAIPVETFQKELEITRVRPAISMIRSKLGDLDKHAKDLIVTIHGKGYALYEVEWEVSWM